MPIAGQSFGDLECWRGVPVAKYASEQTFGHVSLPLTCGYIGRPPRAWQPPSADLCAWRHLDTRLPQVRTDPLGELERSRRIAMQANSVDVELTAGSVSSNHGPGFHHRQHLRQHGTLIFDERPGRTSFEQLAIAAVPAIRRALFERAQTLPAPLFY